VGGTGSGGADVIGGKIIPDVAEELTASSDELVA
jgi:hypothetical protein